MRNRKSLLLAAAIFVGAFRLVIGAETLRGLVTNTVAKAVPSTRLHNLFRATTNVFSGSSPEGDAAFSELIRLGVKTVISVDGAQPDVETARKHGLRYIHLPIGYDGVPTNRVAELIKAAQSQAGPIYVHCHHGKHRGPAAVAVICEGTSGWTTNRAVAWLKEAGTADDYSGLYRSAMEFRLPEATALARIVELPEVVKPSSVVEAMVAIDAEFDRLKAAQKLNWDKIPNQPDISPAQTATILWEHFRELLRSEDTMKRGADYRMKLDSSQKLAEQLRAVLREPKATLVERNTVFQYLGKSCASCHTQYRN